MTGDPPIGTEDAFPKDDPDETAAQRRIRIAGDVTTANTTPMTTAPIAGENRADAIVRREAGVADFSDAEEEDRAGTYQVEDYPGQDTAEGVDRRGYTVADDSPPEIAAQGFKDAVRTVESIADGDTPTDRRSRP